ncbi:MAG: LysR family transcriptional regulator [Cyanobacteria bacterium P01_D01_bin.156]
MAQDRLGQLKPSQLRVLIAVADGGSFSEAALQLQLSQSAVSYAIATLEDDLGVVLFSRGRHGAVLTPVGQQIVERARHVLHLIADIYNQANLAKGFEGGQLRIAAFRSAATHILPEVIAQYCLRYPAIAITIAEYDDRPDVESDLRKGKADVGITYLPHAPDIETSALTQDEFVVLFPPEATLPTPLTWKALAAYPLIMAPDGDSCDAMVIDHGRQYGVELRPTYQIRSDATIVNMVAKGLGSAITPRLAAEPIPKGVQVRSLPDPFYRTICVATVANALLPPPVFAFMEMLQTAMANETLPV